MKFRCYNNITCCPGLSKLTDIRAPGIAQCKPSSYLVVSSNWWKTCNTKRDWGNLSFEEALVDKKAHEQWLGKEKEHLNSNTKAHTHRNLEVEKYFTSKQIELAEKNQYEAALLQESEA